MRRPTKDAVCPSHTDPSESVSYGTVAARSLAKSNRGYEILSGKRPLSLAMIRRLNRSLGVRAKVPIAEPGAG